MQVKDILRTNFLSVKEDERLSRVIGKLAQGAHTEAVVLAKNGKYLGMLWKRGLLRSKIDPTAVKIRKFTVNPASVTPETSLERAAMLLHNSDFHVLPVLDAQKKVIGIVGARDVLMAMKDSLDGIKAKDCCSMSVMSLKESDPLSKAITLLQRKKVDRIPIIDDSGRLIGIVTFIDMLRRFMRGSSIGERTGRQGKIGRTSRSGVDSGEKRSFSSLPIGNAINKLVITAKPSASAKEIIAMLRNSNISCVVLVQNNAPVGIVTTKDLLYAVSRPARI